MLSHLIFSHKLHLEMFTVLAPLSSRDPLSGRASLRMQFCVTIRSFIERFYSSDSLRHATVCNKRRCIAVSIYRAKKYRGIELVTLLRAPLYQTTSTCDQQNHSLGRYVNIPITCCPTASGTCVMPIPASHREVAMIFSRRDFFSRRF
jgi:hypothetical protein